jgi:hypothetical protein
MTFERADFEKMLRTRLKICQEHKLNGLLYFVVLSVGLLYAKTPSQSENSILVDWVTLINIHCTSAISDATGDFIYFFWYSPPPTKGGRGGVGARSSSSKNPQPPQQLQRAPGETR